MLVVAVSRMSLLIQASVPGQMAGLVMSQLVLILLVGRARCAIALGETLMIRMDLDLQV